MRRAGVQGAGRRDRFAQAVSWVTSGRSRNLSALLLPRLEIRYAPKVDRAAARRPQGRAQCDLSRAAPGCWQQELAPARLPAQGCTAAPGPARRSGLGVNAGRTRGAARGHQPGLRAPPTCRAYGDGPIGRAGRGGTAGEEAGHTSTSPPDREGGLSLGRDRSLTPSQRRHPESASTSRLVQIRCTGTEHIPSALG